MDQEIMRLEPQQVWRQFAALNAVPRPSKKEGRVIQFMVDFGKGLGLETLTDAVGNVIVRKPASAGMEGRKTVTLQSHLDMVHQKNADTDFDFDTQGIQMQVVDGWVKAQGTTLGADNGMGVAAIMALLASTDIPHPPLEALFTIDEETGMTGAKGLKGGLLQGEILLNLDTEEDDELDIGCAGGVDITATGTYIPESCPQGLQGAQLRIQGLMGGHSGMDIDKGLGNANKIMNRLLVGLEPYGLRIGSIDGGGLRNAIPRESTAQIAVDESQWEKVKEVVVAFAVTLKAELTPVESELNIEIQETDLPKEVLPLEAQKQLLRILYAAHNGVYGMSRTMPGLVETSNNIARVWVGEGQIGIANLTRSSVETAKADLAQSLQATFELAGYEVELSGDYPGWQPNPDSEILVLMKDRYKVLFEEEPAVVACHAGLECGILGQHYPEMDMISFGPTIRGAHSPDERVAIASVQKFWDYLLDVLAHIPEH